MDKINITNTTIETSNKKNEISDNTVEKIDCFFEDDFELDWSKIPENSLEIDNMIKTNIENYLKNNTEMSEKNIIANIDKLFNYKDILYEFYYTISTNKFPKNPQACVCINSICYTAEKLYNTGKLSIIGAYNYLIYLKEYPEEAVKDLEKGLPNKDSKPPIQSNSQRLRATFIDLNNAELIKKYEDENYKGKGYFEVIEEAFEWIKQQKHFNIIEVKYTYNSLGYHDEDGPTTEITKTNDFEFNPYASMILFKCEKDNKKFELSPSCKYIEINNVNHHIPAIGVWYISPEEINLIDITNR